MMDKAIGLLGPDIELFKHFMFELGEPHADYGVQQELFPRMGLGLLVSISSLLGVGFTDKVRDAWIEVCGILPRSLVCILYFSP